MFRKIRSFLLSVILFLCSLFGFRIGSGGETEMITYDETKTIVTISLDENPSTGYGWEYAAAPEGVVLLTGDQYRSDAPAGVAGAGGIRSFSFTGLREGTAALTFTYLRSWEGDPIRTVVIEVRVAADNALEAALVSDNRQT